MSKKIINTHLTRRQFLKTSTATAAIALLSNRMGANAKAMVEGTSRLAALTDEEIKYGCCRTCHRTYCATVYHLQDGIVTQVEGDTRGPWNKGRLCVRGNSVLMQLYNPYRVKAPLKRTNPEKGLDVDPGWVEISWDEALNTVADKMREIREDDPRKFVIGTGFGADYSLLSNTIGRAFGGATGIGATGAMCSVHWPAQLLVGFDNIVPDPDYAKYIILIGRSLALSAAHGEPSCKDMTDAVQDGLKLVSVDPRCGAEASKGEWVPIRPGTELAFTLGFANVLLHELNVYDEWFVKNRTSGPYLVDKEGVYIRDSVSGKPMVWDAIDQRAKTFDDTTIQDYALEGVYTVGLQTASPVFSVLKEHVKDYTPEWAENICTVSASTIRRLVSEYVDAASIGSTVEIGGVTFPLRPAAILYGRGCSNHRDGHLAAWMTQVINALVGALDVPGGSQAQQSGPYLEPTEDGTVTPSAGHNPSLTSRFIFPPERLDLTEYYPFGFSQGFRVVNAVVEPDKYHIDIQPQLMLTYGHNLYTKGMEAEKITEAQLKIPFLTTISYHLDEHAAFSDIIFPESSVLEWTFTKAITERKFWKSAKLLYGAIVHQPIVSPLYQSRQGDDIFIELADRAGFLFGKGGLNDTINRSLKDELKLELDKKYTINEIVDRTLKSAYGMDKGLEYFAKGGFIAFEREPQDVYNYSYFPGNSTRHPIYNTLLKKTGEDLLKNLKQAGIEHPDWSEEDIRFYYQPLPDWKPTTYYTGKDGYDFYGVVWKLPPFLFDISNTNSNPYLQEIMSKDPYFGKLLINTKKAAEKGLKDGDMVFVENMFGSRVGPIPVKTTGIVQEEVAGFASGLSRKAFGMNPITSNGISFNPLLSSRGEVMDIVTDAFDNSPRVKVYKA